MADDLAWGAWCSASSLPVQRAHVEQSLSASTVRLHRALTCSASPDDDEYEVPTLKADAPVTNVAEEEEEEEEKPSAVSSPLLPPPSLRVQRL